MQTFTAQTIKETAIAQKVYYIWCQYCRDNDLDIIEFWIDAETISQATHKAYIYLRAEDIEPVNIKNIEIALDN